MLSLDTWYLTLVLDILLLDTWYLTLDIWHQYLTCYYFTPDTWHLISNTSTWHVILDTWYLTSVLDMLSLDTWYLTPDIWHLTVDMLSPTWHAFTWYQYTWHLILWNLTLVLHGIFMTITFTGTWHDYYTVTRPLVLLNSCTPELWYPLYSCPLHCYSC